MSVVLCLILAFLCILMGEIVIIALAVHEHSHSEKRYDSEYWKFMYYMKILDASEDAVRKVLRDTKDLSDFKRVNSELEAAIHKNH